MRLKRFKERKQKKMGMIVGISSIVLLFALVIVYRTYSIYQEKQKFDVIRGSVPDQNYDVMFTFYFIEKDGTKKIIETIPEGRDYDVDVNCNHNANGSWNQDTWGPVIANLTSTRTKCGITFEKLHGPLEDYGIEELEVIKGSGIYQVPHTDARITYTSDATAIANLKRTEYRYAGSSPNNYVTFNGEVAGWRLIGLVNTPEGQRLKLIRDESIGEYSWYTIPTTVNNGYGINEWSQADIQRVLNREAYYNRTSGKCYIGANNASTSCDFSQNGLTEESKQMIDTVTWNTGTSGKSYDKSGTTIQYYNYERSNKTGKYCTDGGTYCNDVVKRTTFWEGQVGLMYLSDYGYATSGGSTLDRNQCMSIALSSWTNEENNDCKQNDWLYQGYQWSMMPQSSNKASALFLESAVHSSGAYGASGVKPTIYLKESIIIHSGNGTQQAPYQLQLN